MALKENYTGPVRKKAAFFLDNTILNKRDCASLLNPTDWVCDNIITAFGKLVMLRVNIQEPTKKNRIVVVDSQYSAKLTMESGNYQHRSLVGMLTREKTDATEKYFFPTNVLRKHWFLIVADIQNGDIIGMDTFKSDRTKALKRVQNFLTENWGAIGNGDPPEWKLKMLKPDAMPLQKDSYSCGIYTCMFMDLVSARVRPGSFKTFVNHNNISAIRRRMAKLMDGFFYS